MAFAKVPPYIPGMHGGGSIDITPEILLKAYAAGIFPMAENADDPALYWIEPERRGINSIQLFKDPERGWRIMSMIWDNEREGVSLPDF